LTRPARDLALDLDHARDLALDLARDHALDLALDLARTLARARALAFARDHALERAFDLDRALALALDLVHVESIAIQARQLVVAVERCRDRARQVLGEHGVNASGAVRRLSPVACRVIGQAVRVLPVVHRCRYGEEFRGDLAEIAQAGRWAQVRFALGVLGRVWVLRVALRGVPPEAPERVGPG
jgi:hypothetical protein